MTDKLLKMIPNLSAVEFTGLARVLKVKLYKDEKDEDGHFITRDFSDVLKDVLDNFDKQSRERKREILRIVKKASSKSRGRAADPDGE